MNTINLSAEIFRELSYIADDENYLKKALSSIKQLVSQKEKAQQAKEIAEADEEYRPLSKAELLDNIEKAFRDAKLVREGKLKAIPAEELLHDL